MRTSKRSREEPSLLGLKPGSLFQEVLDDVGVSLVIVDHEGHIVMANRAAISMFGGADPTGLSLQQWRETHRILDDQGRDIPIDQSAVMRALRGEEVLPQDCCLVLPDGRTKWIHGAGYYFSVLGLTGVLVIFADETKRVELKRAADLIQRLEAVGRLAGGMVHDFNNMLSIVYEHVVLATSHQGMPEAGLQHLEKAVLALQKGRGLVKKLIQFSHTRRARASSVQVNEAVSAALDLARPLISLHVRLQTDLQRDLPPVDADAADIEQAVVNLILNALDAMPDGGELRLQTKLTVDWKADAGDAQAKKFVLISVADTGTGIPDGLHAKIFEPFFTTKPQGSGLGLSSTFGTVRQHGGEIRFQSTPGKGSTFSIYFPIQGSAGLEAKEPSD